MASAQSRRLSSACHWGPVRVAPRRAACGTRVFPLASVRDTSDIPSRDSSPLAAVSKCGTLPTHHSPSVPSAQRSGAPSPPNSPAPADLASPSAPANLTSYVEGYRWPGTSGALFLAFCYGHRECCAIAPPFDCGKLGLPVLCLTHGTAPFAQMFFTQLPRTGIHFYLSAQELPHTVASGMRAMNGASRLACPGAWSPGGTGGRDVAIRAPLLNHFYSSIVYLALWSSCMSRGPFEPLEAICIVVLGR